MDHTVIEVVAVAVVESGKLLVVSEQFAPDVFCLPGGKPEPGEEPERTPERELYEELGVAPGGLERRAVVEETAALEDVLMHLTVFSTPLIGDPSMRLDCPPCAGPTGGTRACCSPRPSNITYCRFCGVRRGSACPPGEAGQGRPLPSWWNCSSSVEPLSAVVEEAGLTAVETRSK
ncbi:NUDIX domain-containing protein [Streptomyces sp. AcE210]|uniref:NUDIX domain-containing protein n=1 Tax=Streptomyces sp. AcE210 TaxID=2292703 RepID=UPI001F0BE4D9|nr:NUDIX domain-containing protein [Streptomyces sp. AcE210]